MSDQPLSAQSERVRQHKNYWRDLAMQRGERLADAYDALRETVDLCNALREYAPTLSTAAEKRLRDSLALLGDAPDQTHAKTGDS